MDRRPIGVFDSGLGGLTSMKKLIELMPGEDIVYLGDTGRLPYGTRSRETIVKYARQDIAFLEKHGVKAVVVACGTVSTNALDAISEECREPVFGVVEAAAAKAVSVTRSGRIGLLGTSATIRSGAYEKKILSLMPEAKVYGTACPLFVPLVENGRTDPDDIVVRTVAEEYLAGLRASGADTLILGCTHYPLLMRVIARVMGDGVTLVSAGAETAQAVADYIRRSGLGTDRQTGGRHLYCVTDSTEDFARMADLFLGDAAGGEVRKVDVF